MREIDPIVAIDTMTLVWGIREEGPPEQCGRAKYLFLQFHEEKTQVILPTVVLTEYLTAFPKSVHDQVSTELAKRFHFKPFDEACVSDAAHLFQIGSAMRVGDVSGGRAILRADTMIVATAKAYGATTLYSGDAKLRALAQKVMNAPELPKPYGPLFSQNS